MMIQPDRSVRPALVGDAEFIAQMQVAGMMASLEATLEAELPAAVRALVENPQVELAWQETLRAPARSEVAILVAVEGAKPCGYALGILSKADDTHEHLSQLGVEIAGFEVSAEESRQGHGSRLLAALSDVFKGQAHHVNTWIMPGDKPRVRFFQSAGFAPAGIQRRLQVGENTVIQHLWWALY
ncbi:acetyltransferase, GNAT family [Gleimia coleocanis DSM 15436]|uniref:Acetyltransferase, GNAT family n=1 Tax=Gleimia coleocanis DSM 15436 TaxID=525245 RepID=C0W0D5_9ACTO|nr:GNAT family N-acetyltransferase [Gleimia coleocanis]EEH63994.1 acetyltransferase, GNAT family [Gleimia coleocanis DSM 15436]